MLCQCHSTYAHTLGKDGEPQSRDSIPLHCQSLPAGYNVGREVAIRLQQIQWRTERSTQRSIQWRRIDIKELAQIRRSKGATNRAKGLDVDRNVSNRRSAGGGSRCDVGAVRSGAARTRYAGVSQEEFTQRALLVRQANVSAQLRGHSVDGHESRRVDRSYVLSYTVQYARRKSHWRIAWPRRNRGPFREWN